MVHLNTPEAYNAIQAIPIWAKRALYGIKVLPLSLDTNFVFPSSLTSLKIYVFIYLMTV